MKFSSVSSRGRLGFAAIGAVLSGSLVIGCGDDGGDGGAPGSNRDASAAVTGDAAAPVTEQSTPSDSETTSSGVTSAETSTASAAPFDAGDVTDSVPDGGQEPIVVLDGGVDAGDASQTLFDGGPVTQPVESDASDDGCGGQGQVCCAGATMGAPTCDEGLDCNDPNGAGLTNSECIATAIEADAGPATCGGQGQNCCPAVRGNPVSCNDGLVCNNPGGPNLNDSECLIPVVLDGGACGGLNQPCCEGPRGNGVCNDDLDCESNPPRGLEGNLCVEP